MCPLPFHHTYAIRLSPTSAINYVRTCPNAIFRLDNLIFGCILRKHTWSESGSAYILEANDRFLSISIASNFEIHSHSLRINVRLCDTRYTCFSSCISTHRANCIRKWLESVVGKGKADAKNTTQTREGKRCVHSWSWRTLTHTKLIEVSSSYTAIIYSM